MVAAEETVLRLTDVPVVRGAPASGVDMSLYRPGAVAGGAVTYCGFRRAR